MVDSSCQVRGYRSNLYIRSEVLAAVLRRKLFSSLQHAFDAIDGGYRQGNRVGEQITETLRVSARELSLVMEPQASNRLEGYSDAADFLDSVLAVCNAVTDTTQPEDRVRNPMLKTAAENRNLQLQAGLTLDPITSSNKGVNLAYYKAAGHTSDIMGQHLLHVIAEARCNRCGAVHRDDEFPDSVKLRITSQQSSIDLAELLRAYHGSSSNDWEPKSCQRCMAVSERGQDIGKTFERQKRLVNQPQILLLDLERRALQEHGIGPGAGGDVFTTRITNYQSLKLQDLQQPLFSEQSLSMAAHGVVYELVASIYYHPAILHYATAITRGEQWI